MDEILDLLRSSVNEKKFAGLLLATKFLPAGDEGAVTAVHDAVGITFIDRLLLGLRSPAGSRQEPTEEEVRTASSGLGLAVLAKFTTVPALAQSQDIIQNVPLLLKVLRDGGLSGSSESKSTAPGGNADDAAVQDALEALVNVVRASEDGQIVALQSGAIAAAVTTLQRVATSAQPTPRQVVALLSGLLQTPLRGQLLADEGEVLAAAVPPLAVLLAKPPLPIAGPSPPAAANSSEASDGASVSISDLLKAAAVSRQSSGGSQAAASTSGPQQAEQSSAADSGSPEQETAFKPQPKPSVAAADDAAAAQLEVLHAMLLLLPPPEGSRMASSLAVTATTGSKEAASWPGNVREGLQAIMAARAPPATKQAALSLAAATVDVNGHAWLAGDPLPQGGNPPGAFYQLVTELAAIEVKVLLMDALRSTEAAAAESTTAQSRATGTRVQDAAEALLPMCFRLLEAAVEVLATHSEQAGGPALDDRVAARAIDTLDGAFEAVLQYLEQSLPSAADGGSDSPLQLAALRALCSYLADVPQAHSDRVRKLLPCLISLTGGTGSSAQAVAFLLPVISQNTGLGLVQSDDTEALSSATDPWHAAVQDDKVVLAVARAAADLSTQARAASSVQSSEYAEDMLLDMWAILAYRLSPTNRRNADAFDILRQTSPTPAADAAAVVTEALSPPLATAMADAVAAFNGWQDRQHAVNDPHSLPALRQHRLTVLAGSVAASFAALATATLPIDGVQQPQQRPPSLPPDAMRLVASALELACRFGLESHFPSDVQPNDQAAVLQLLDANTGHMLDLLDAVAIVAAADPAMRECLRRRPWVQRLAQQMPRSDPATPQEQLSTSSRLHRIVALLTNAA